MSKIRMTLHQISIRADFWCYVIIDDKRKLLFPDDKFTCSSDKPFHIVLESLPIGVFEPINLDSNESSK